MCVCECVRARVCVCVFVSDGQAPCIRSGRQQAAGGLISEEINTAGPTLSLGKRDGRF